MYGTQAQALAALWGQPSSVYLVFSEYQGILNSQDLLSSGQRAGTLEVSEGYTCQGPTVPGAPTSQCLTTGNPLGTFVKATRSTGIQDILQKQTPG